MAKKRTHVQISGHVQGVFFRANTRDRANRLSLTGWVRNLTNGDVEVVVEGEEERIKELINWCKEGPPMARVTNIEVNWEKTTDEFDSFNIKY